MARAISDMKLMRPFNLIVAVMLFAAQMSAGAPSSQPASLSTTTVLHDQKDRAITPLNLPSAHRAVVLIFISTDCPISNSYAPEIGTLCNAFIPDRIDFYTVYEDAALTPAAATVHHDAYAFPCDALLDTEQALAHVTGASVTPEAIVVGPGGVKLYAGRIDDQYVSVGRKRFTVTTHDLKDVLNQIAADQPVTVSSTPPIGCAIPK